MSTTSTSPSPSAIRRSRRQPIERKRAPIHTAGANRGLATWSGIVGASLQYASEDPLDREAEMKLHHKFSIWAASLALSVPATAHATTFEAGGSLVGDFNAGGDTLA